MTILKIAAFSDGDTGGNPAGIWIGDVLPGDDEMQRIAADVGFSETAFACPDDTTEGAGGWRVRYFSPESEVPFCGHATIALGAALAMRNGDGVFPLKLNKAAITVEGRSGNGLYSASLQSPPTRSLVASDELVTETLELFGYAYHDLCPDIPPALVHGGSDHLLLGLTSREALAAMHYDLAKGRELMSREGLVTIILVFAETRRLFHTRNAFASGGIHEDPATGAAAAAMAGYLADIRWKYRGPIEVIQGEDMGMRSRLLADIPQQSGGSIRVSGTARLLD